MANCFQFDFYNYEQQFYTIYCDGGVVFHGTKIIGCLA